MLAQPPQVAPLQAQMRMRPHAKDVIDFLRPLATAGVLTIRMHCEEAGAEPAPFSIVATEGSGAAPPLPLDFCLLPVRAQFAGGDDDPAYRAKPGRQAGHGSTQNPCHIEKCHYDGQGIQQGHIMFGHHGGVLVGWKERGPPGGGENHLGGHVAGETGPGSTKTVSRCGISAAMLAKTERR